MERNDPRLQKYIDNTPDELIASMESYVEKFNGLVDVLNNPMQLYGFSMESMVSTAMMENFDNMEASMKLTNSSYEDGATVTLESMVDDNVLLNGDEVTEQVDMSNLHRKNLQQLFENSTTEMRIANTSVNRRGLSEFTPYDAFLPFVILRSYLPLIGKDLIPYIVPKAHFIRIKQQYKWIVTKDNRHFLEPDVYSDYEAVGEILESAKGDRVTDKWYPETAVEEVVDKTAADFSDYDETGAEKFYSFTDDKFAIEALDLLGESGGIRDQGDALDINICINGARAMVTNSEGNTYMVTLDGLQGFIDTTSISPKNQLGVKVKFPVKNAADEIERWVEDQIMGTYDPYTNRVDITSLHGFVKQVQFGGNLSNKNNINYLTFHDEMEATQHPIPEGYRSNMPITVEDMRLYNETGNIEILAYGINRITELFTNVEDSSIVGSIVKHREKWRGKDTHPFEHFQRGRIFVTRTCNLSHEQNNPFMENSKYVQDKISSDIRLTINDIRNTCYAEPFRVVMYCHPNIASLFVGENYNMRVTQGASLGGGIRQDYNMGIYTQNGDAMRLITSMKFNEEDGIQGLVFPVNEQNFLTWKHFKRALYFDRDHKIKEMPNNPNLMCVATFHTHAYIPMAFQIKIKGYYNPMTND